MKLGNNLLSRILYRLYFYIWSSRYKNYRKQYEIDNKFIFNGPDVRFYGKGRIIIDEKTHIGSYSTIQSVEGCIVHIGKNCRISHNVRIYTKSEIADQDFSKTDLNKKIGNVVINDHVWVGVNTYINPNVKIGENSVIGANSVVTKDVPKNCIVGGVPAKIIKYKDI